ncbi:MAG: Flp pilus assembly protein TadB [uncultured Paraburkholderia sp.]|uniref:type II secretion system F family protein n=1 Tax=uncultured Paraburkholderia sp. TaxID=1822466 RepID=UPI002593DE33|nr:type II secretion system F family protein [uncultured Paraburkholderia sp.]CAH2902987.1 MAG: Flp pilus assembly protein TadB [uncultured Paraburkholderia sp.]CAH2938220.1 MAG: Flp pilus assembly protein TadB [uncultured Paraburkholderia sp.]
MNPIFYAFAFLLFVAVVLGIEGVYQWWNSHHGPAARRLDQRIRALSAGAHVHGERLSILKERMLSNSAPLHALMLRVPRIHAIDRIVVQSGLSHTIGRLVMHSVAAVIVVLLAASFSPVPVPTLVMVLAVAAALAFPTLRVLRARARRLRVLERQLPEAADMISRALRAGHSFSSAIGMLGNEFAEPTGGEFRTVFDEINYGVTMNEALLNLATRVPVRDLRYFVIAVLIQRETGGNLAEILDSIASLVRDRLRLFDQVRVLSAEGRLSAWIIGLLPFAAAGAMNLLNPSFLSVLWEDPAGLKVIESVFVSMLFGVLWMRRIVRIRV